MGGCDFTVGAKGANAKEAFKRAVEDAKYESGHGGYTGTIAEKGSFVMMGTAKTKKEAYAMVDQFLSDGDPRIDDKWGPAGCITVEEGPGFGFGFYIFFGIASS